MADVGYENIVKVLLYGSVDEGRAGHLSKQPERRDELLSAVGLRNNRLTPVQEIMKKELSCKRRAYIQLVFGCEL